MGIDLAELSRAVDPPNLFSDPGSMVEPSNTFDRDAPPPDEGEGGEGEGGEKKLSLAELLEQHPHLKGEIDEHYVKPNVTAARDEAYTRGATESEPALRERIRLDGLREEYDRLSVKAMKDGDKAAGQRALEIKGELDRHESSRTTLAQMQRQVVDEVLTGVLGIDPKAVPPDARRNFDTLRAWSLTQSPAIQGVIAQATGAKKKDDEVVGDATRAAQFGAQVASTPAPNTGATGGGSGATVVGSGKTKTYADIEQGYIEGRVSFEEYSEARSRNPRIRPRI